MVGVVKTEAQKAGSSTHLQPQIIPTAIFLDRNISVLEALAEYLVEEYRLSSTQIGRLINRDKRNVWTSYRRAKEKREHRTPTPTTGIFFPLSAVRDRSLSIFEAIVVYLRDEEGHTNNELAAAFGRSAKTISTVYTRAKRKDHG